MRLKTEDLLERMTNLSKDVDDTFLDLGRALRKLQDRVLAAARIRAYPAARQAKLHEVCGEEDATLPRHQSLRSILASVRSL